jgi:DNA primase
VGNDDMFDDPQLQKVFSLYKDLYRKGLEPGPKNFLYHEDSRVSSVVLKLLEFPYEVSPNWQEQFEMKVPSKEETYREDTLSTLTFLKLRKIRRLIEENQKDLEKPHTDSEQMVLLQTHQHLKDMEARLLKRMGTVIFR